MESGSGAETAANPTRRSPWGLLRARDSDAAVLTAFPASAPPARAGARAFEHSRGGPNESAAKQPGGVRQDHRQQGGGHGRAARHRRRRQSPQVNTDSSRPPLMPPALDPMPMSSSRNYLGATRRANDGLTGRFAAQVGVSQRVAPRALMGHHDGAMGELVMATPPCCTLVSPTVFWFVRKSGANGPSVFEQLRHSYVCSAVLRAMRCPRTRRQNLQNTQLGDAIVTIRVTLPTGNTVCQGG